MKESLLFSHQVVNLLSHVHILFRQSLDFFVKVINKTQWMGEKKDNEKNIYKHIILVLFVWVGWHLVLKCVWEWINRTQNKYSCPEENLNNCLLPVSNLSWRLCNSSFQWSNHLPFLVYYYTSTNIVCT
jgi:hypothetical protein